MNPLTMIFCILLIIYNKKILFPNGLYATNILYNLAKKEFGNSIGPCRDYIVLKNEIIKSLKKEDPQKIKDKKFCTLVTMEHLKEHSFANYMSVKFSYWSVIIATIVLFFGDKIVEHCTQ